MLSDVRTACDHTNASSHRCGRVHVHGRLSNSGEHTRQAIVPYRAPGSRARSLLGPVDLDAGLTDAKKRSGTYTAHHHCIDLLVVQHLQGIARAMNMVLVAVCNGSHRIGCSIDSDERKRRAEMIENCAFKSFVLP